MISHIRVPPIENANAELSVGRWFKNAGDPVSSGEPLVEIETADKTYEIQAPETGVLSTILVRDGGFVEIGTALGIITQF
jgi:2-oxoglutarate dehydrogenase E2 component (dihydrolipoamide succinyltransferase)